MIRKRRKNAGMKTAFTAFTAFKAFAVVLAVMIGAGITMAAEPALAKTADKQLDTVAAHAEAGGDVFDFSQGEAQEDLEEEAANFPAHYDLRNADLDGDGVGDNVSFITPVKLQNPYGTCWGFAAVAAAESSILSSEELNNDGTGQPRYSLSSRQGSDGLPVLDLSEKHLAYFATSHIDDPDHPQNGEGTYFGELSQKDLDTSAYRYDTGGITLYATALFASGIGPNLEDRTDPNADGASMLDILSYRGRNAEQIERKVPVAYDAEGKAKAYEKRPVWYSDEDDWSIPDDYRFYQSFRLKDSFVLPSPAGRKNRLNEDGMNAIKQQLVENHRAVSITFAAESFLPGQDTTGKRYMSSNWAHYTYDGQFPTHMVTIVGYDDNYPAENFLEDHQPPDNGAFLIKNSWGSEMNDFPNNGNRHWGLLEGMDGVPYDENATPVSDRSTGYFWVSYYDRSLYDPEAFEFDKPTGENGYYVEQMDYLQPSEYIKNDTPDTRMANVFRAEETTSLSEVSVMTTVPGTTASYEVYLLPDGFDDPEDGVLVAAGSDTFAYGGYHKIAVKKEDLVTDKLPERDHLVLAKNQMYSVIVTETESGDAYTCAGTAIAGTEKTEHTKAVVNKGESFYYDGEQWRDFSGEDVQKAYLGYSGSSHVVDNFPIKSYLEPLTFTVGEGTEVFKGYLTLNNWEEGNPGSFSVEKSVSKSLTAEFRGNPKNMPAEWDPALLWSSGDESIMSVEPAEDNNDGEVIITGMSAGKTLLIADAGEYGVRVVGVNVELPRIYGFELDDWETKVYNGGEWKPEVLEVYFSSKRVELEPKEGVDYEVTYENNVNAGEASVTVTGIGEFSGSATTSFRIYPADNDMSAEGMTLEMPAKTESIRTIDAADVFAVTGAKGELSYAKTSGDERITVDGSTGAFTLEKGLNEGSYKVEVDITDNGGTNYKKKTIKTAVTVTISKSKNTLTVSPKTAVVKYSKLKKKAQTLAVSKVIRFTKKGQGKMSYTLSSAKKGSKSFKKYFKISKTTGKVTIKKNKKMKKGTYKVKVKVKAAGNADYKASAVKTVTFKVKVE